ncbi:DUF5623 domain-containing protein [Rhizobium sp. PAMB 3182]
MLNDGLRPTTILGIKSLAADLRKKHGVKYSQALDIAAKAANFTNFRNAQRVLNTQEESPSRPYVMLTMYWQDRKQRHKHGRETLKIYLSEPILDICTKSALKNVRGFRDLRMVAEDHFVSDMLAGSQSYARGLLCTAQRSLRFMEITGLRPYKAYGKAYPLALSRNQLPYRDHSTGWVDPNTGQFILVDEPYRGTPNEEERAAWAAQYGWKVIKTSWPGMYNPYSCDLYIVTNDRSDYELESLVKVINDMSPPLLESDWSGESSPTWETFVSPKARSAQDIRRAKSRGTIYPLPSATTVPYSYSPGQSLRKPAAKMGVEAHKRAGRIIKAVIESKMRPYAVYNRMNSLRSTLEDWMNLEIDRGVLEGGEFFDVYYDNGPVDPHYQGMASTHTGIIAILEELRQMLRSAYPDCAPLRRQLGRIDVSISLISKVKSTVA